MKVLFIRLSSIGDIVLTTPLVRCVNQQIANVEIHYLCKDSYRLLLSSNPYIHQLHTFNKEDKTLKKRLKDEKFDYVIDLQHNCHSKSICRYLKVPYRSFPKLNIRKWILVNFKINLLPKLHIVDRYFKALKVLKVTNDNKGLNFFISDKDLRQIQTDTLPEVFVAVAVGSKHNTKQLPKEKLLEIFQKTNIPFVFLGDEKDAAVVEYIQANSQKTSYNLCGKLNLQESAYCVSKAEILLSGDTGLMHIAAALNKPIVSLWGNTVPEFGMYPYMPMNQDKYVIIENKKLFCRPCSKLGFKRCPLRHFKCMQSLSIDEIVACLNRL